VAEQAKKVLLCRASWRTGPTTFRMPRRALHGRCRRVRASAAVAASRGRPDVFIVDDDPRLLAPRPAFQPAAGTVDGQTLLDRSDCAPPDAPALSEQVRHRRPRLEVCGAAPLDLHLDLACGSDRTPPTDTSRRTFESAGHQPHPRDVRRRQLGQHTRVSAVRPNFGSAIIRRASALMPGTIGPQCVSVVVQPWRSSYVLRTFDLCSSRPLTVVNTGRPSPR
jgi:hypothetical protein